MNRNMKAITWAMEQKALDPIPFKLLIMLAARVGEKNFNVWPSYQTMADDAHIGNSTARHYVAVLCDMGLIKKIGILKRDNGGRSSNIYRLMVGQVSLEEEPYDGDAPTGVTALTEQGGAPARAGGPAICRAGIEPLTEGTSINEEPPYSPPGGESELPLESQPDLTDVAVTAFQERWAQLADRHAAIEPIGRRLSTDRKNELMARMKEHGATTPDEIRDLILELAKRIDGSPWHCGEEKGSRWCVTWVWVLKKTNFQKCLVLTNRRKQMEDNGEHEVQYL